jgi:hypothetical protein
MPFNGNKWDWSKGVSFEEIMSTVKNVFGNKIIKLTDKKNDTSKATKLMDLKALLRLSVLLQIHFAIRVIVFA